VNIKELVEFHKKNKKAVTVTAVQPDSRFGVLDINANNEVKSFLEKPKGESGWINGGFFVCEPKVFDFIGENEDSIFENEPLQNMAKNGELYAYKHKGFWKCMDTLRDKHQLNTFWESKNAKWKKW
jgi:glucose-1-phosphate cytidylyltransferase